MRVRVNMNSQAIRALSRAQLEAAKMSAQQLINNARNEAVIPFDIGTLQNESTFVDDRKAKSGIISIVHDTPYARRLYYHPEYDFNTSKNANARGEWWEEWITGSKKSQYPELFKKFYSRIAGRYVT